MAIRFLFFWAIVSCMPYAWFWLMNRTQKKSAKKQSFRFIVSAIVGLAIVVPLFLINQISGV